MSYNPYTLLRGLLPEKPLQVGRVITIDAGQAKIQLPDGTYLIARGTGQVGGSVYVRDGLIEGEAPTLPVYEIEV